MVQERPVAVRVHDLCHNYGNLQAVRGISFEIGQGECFGLLGPNGAGKTTTIEILEGLLVPTAGDVEVLGRRWRSDAVAIRERLGVCLQQTTLSERLCVGETVALFRSLYRTGRDPAAVIRDVGLTEKQGARVGTLSGGQKQRLAIALALVGDPELVFLDEPTTGLDPQSRRQLWELVRSFKARGRTVLLTTHYMDEAERLCDRIAVIDHGRVIAEGTPVELIRSLGGEHVVSFETSAGARIERQMLEQLTSVRSVHEEAGAILLTVGEPHLTIPALLELLGREGLSLASLATRHAS